MAFFLRFAAAPSLFWPLVAAGTGVGLLALPGAYPLGWQPLAWLVALLVVVCLRPQRSALNLALWLVLGYCYGYWQMGAALDQRLPLCADASIREFEVLVLSAPQLSGAGEAQAVARFEAEVLISAADDCPVAGSYRVRLSWYGPPALAAGERWRVEGRLRPPWGNLNPGGFDYERWLLGEALAGTGYVRSGTRLAPPSAATDLRELIRSAFRRWLEARNSAHGGIMLALMTGDDSGLSQRDWRLLRDSGTVHLLVVSGLHVGMVSGFLFLLGRLLARGSLPLLLRFGARQLAGLFALAGSAAYVWLSGAGVPALRAWLMSALVLLALTSGRSARAPNVVLLVMAVLLLINPLVVHQQGFWLSFAAVLALVAWFDPSLPAAGERSQLSRICAGLGAFVQVQLVLLLVLSPLLAAFQGGVPVQSPIINALAVPVVTFLVLPAVLLAGLLYFPLPVLAELPLQLAEAALELLMSALVRAAEVPAVAMGLAGFWQWLLMLLLLIWLRHRPRWCYLPLAGALWWVLLLPDGQAPGVGQFRLTALDVGQGSALLIDTHRHRLIFDAGPRYASGFDLGDAVVVPSFQRLGQGPLDVLVISHDDVDHAGGARAIIEQLQPKRILASFALGAAEACRAGEGWEWDGVSFRFLHGGPFQSAGSQLRLAGGDNDRSCVLLVSNGRRSLLLAGDISRRVERRLTKQPVDLLMAPHHGSRTSSSAGFVRGFAPAIVFISTDRRSRYGHPHAEVVERYAGSQLWITGRAGALQWVSSRPGRVYAYRERRAAYWQRRYEPLRP